ncbi:MAG: hypothetical protein PHE77_03720 [Candidatus Pacebacteria bacterium]|nr:hypothetical protein [Candidatus Paceibacterota bacterium]
MIKKLQHKILISMALALALGGLAWGNVLAAGLVVQFENQPLFKEANFLPGDGITRFIKVQNNDTVSHKIIVETINETDPDNFAKELNLVIKKGSDVLYSNTLKEFFDTGEYYLEDLTNGSQAQYDFTISFKENTGNEFQEKSLGFDILIGFQGGEQSNGEQEGNTLTSLGGGGVVLPPGLTILDESVTTTVSNQCFATIYWHTNYFSTSQVIFDTVPGTFDLSVGPPKYGYAFSQEGDDSGQDKVTSHQVTLYGLISGETYYYRAISHASPATISRQYSFVMCSCSQQNQTTESLPGESLPGQEPKEPIAFHENTAPQIQVLGESQEIVGENEISTQGSSPTTAEEQAVSGFNNWLANISSFFGKSFNCLKCLPWWLGIILVLLSLQKIAWLFRKAKKELDLILQNKLKKAGIAWIAIGAASFIITLTFYLTKSCFYWWLIVIFFALHILIYQFMVPKRSEQKRKVSYFVIFQIIVLVVAIILGLWKSCLWAWLLFLILAIIFINNKK